MKSPPRRANAADRGGARRRDGSRNGKQADSTSRPFVVTYKKFNGQKRIYGAYATYAAFQETMERYWCLRWIKQEGLTRLTAAVLKEDLLRVDGESGEAVVLEGVA